MSEAAEIVHEETFATAYPMLTQYSFPMKAAERKIVGRENEIAQLMAALSRPELCNAVLLAPPGSGKLLPLDTPIPTPTGWTTMGDLHPGHWILGQDGRPAQVSFESEVDEKPELYELSFSDGSSEIACADHQWLVSSDSQRDRLTPSGVVEIEARRERDAARRAGYRSIMESLPEGHHVTAMELVEMVADVPYSTWSHASSLRSYLISVDVPTRKATRPSRQQWKGSVRDSVLHVVELDARAALQALCDQPRRSRSKTLAESVMTTRQMVDKGVWGSDGRNRFAIRVANPLELPAQPLPVDPYALGAWLGDGLSSFKNVAVIVNPDEQIVDEIVASGYPLKTVSPNRASDVSNPREGMAKRYSFVGLGVDLHKAGLKTGKHIPQVFLRASYEQRLALLQGLMDTDGTIDANGGCELTLSDERLAQDAEELIRTLGIKVSRRVSDASYKATDGSRVECKPRHRMVFTTTQQVFRLERKKERLPQEVRPTQGLLYITDIKPVESRPGKCIQVDNADSMYLCGRSFVPTHNTALVQGAMLADPSRSYREVDLSRMISELNNPAEMAARLKRLFDEAERYIVEQGHELVLFIDEFHQVVQLSPAAVEALKPVLAASGARGIRVIAATTFEEFQTHVMPNQPLVERLQRINLAEPDRKTTIEILRGMAERYEVANQFYDDHMYELIYEFTNRYTPQSSQPRKSILVLDSMVGWHRFTKRPIDKRLLADVLYESQGVNIAFRVDAAKIKAQMDRKVFAQDAATSVISKRLQLCVADLNDKGRPMSSFLFAGSTGVGKSNACSTPVPVYTEDGSVAWKTMGELVPGDQVFKRTGEPERVLGIFPQGKRDTYRITLWDGRQVDADGEHIWPVYTSKMRSNKHAGRPVRPRLMTTLDMLDKGVVRTYPGDDREHLKFFIPANGAVQWPQQDLAVAPYVMGVFIGNGSLTTTELCLSSDDAVVVMRVADSIGVSPKQRSGNYDWVLPTGEKWGTRDRLIQTADFFAEAPDLIGCYSAQRRIPEQYLHGSVEQRWELVRGLFDTDGTIDGSTGRFNVSYSTFSKGLAEDIRSLLFSLGVSNTLKTWTRTKDDGRVLVEYDIHVKVGNEDKEQFFWLPRKRQIAAAAAPATSGRERVKKFDMVGITSIEKLPEPQDMVCIYVDDPEHLYQVGDFVVTHNTEATKQLAHLLFGDAQRHLIRFDMTEFSQDDSVDRFKDDLTSRVWQTPFSVILLDEVEKAASPVTRILLQALDDGRMTDRNGRQVSFLNSYFVLTTNAGSEIFETIGHYASSDDGSGKELVKYEKAIRRSITSTTGDNRFPPELLGRIDAIVPFQPLSRNTQREIVLSKLAALRTELLTKHDVKLAVDQKVVQYLIEDHGEQDASAGGARAAIGKLTDEVVTAVAAFINTYPNERSIKINIEGELVSDNKQMLESDAHVIVTSHR